MISRAQVAATSITIAVLALGGAFSHIGAGRVAHSERVAAEARAVRCAGSIEAAGSRLEMAAADLAETLAGGGIVAWRAAAGDRTTVGTVASALIFDSAGRLLDEVVFPATPDDRATDSSPPPSPTRATATPAGGTASLDRPVARSADPDRLLVTAPMPVTVANGSGAGVEVWSVVAAPANALLTAPACQRPGERADALELTLGESSSAGARIVALSGAPRLADPTLVTLDLFGAPASLALMPVAGWSPDRPQLRHLLLLIALAMIAGAATYTTVQAPHELREQLAARELEIAGANRRWLDEVERRHGLEEAAAQVVRSDSLTGLPSREDFLSRLAHALVRVRRGTDPGVAILFIGLDRFKNVNESLGYTAGDEVLREIARRLEEIVRPSDEIARVSSDRFVVLTYEIPDVGTALEAADRLRRDLHNPFVVEGHEIFLSVSIGVHRACAEVETAEETLAKAETALHEAKTLGGGQAVLFDPSMPPRAGSYLQLESDLRRSIGGEDFKLAFQPIVCLKTRRIIGFESLIRWIHPTNGPISPIDFIPLAEETGLIVPITRWVLGNAARQLSFWRESGEVDEELYISVNLSSRDFDEPGLAEFAHDLRLATNLPPRSIRLEITEGAFMRNVQKARTQIDTLRALHFPILLDDFGTGYSSLSYLDRFAFDYLKIDRSFVQRLKNGDDALIRAILDLARHMNLQTVAEGLESEDDCSALEALGCHFGQGYVFSKPVFADEAIELLARGRARKEIVDEQTVRAT